MKHHAPLATLGVAFALAVLSSCGAPAATMTDAPASQAASASDESAAQEAATEAATVAAVAPQVTTGQGSITVTGSGNGQTAPIPLDQPYYLVKTTNAAAADYGSVMVTVEGKELPAIISLAAESLSVFRPDSGSVVLNIESQGAYTLEFSSPPALSTAVAAPQTFKGAAGTTVTPLVKTKSAPATVTLTYLGEPDPEAATGMMLASASLYDATTGDMMTNVPVYVNKAKPEASDTARSDEPGTYFLIVTGSSDTDPWEASITEG